MVATVLAGLSSTEKIALQRARELDRVRREQDLKTVSATLELQDPPAGGMTLDVEISVTARLVTVRIHHTRLQIATSELGRDFDEIGGAAFLPRGTVDPATAAAGPVSEAGREDTPTSDRGEGGEG